MMYAPRRSRRFILNRYSALICSTILLLVNCGMAGELLVSDRLTNSVYRYSAAGELLGTVLTDDVNLNGPSGLQISPDLTKLYVASSQTNSIIQYEYDYSQGEATNPIVFATQGLLFPNSILFAEDGQSIYASNLGGTGVAQFNLDGQPIGTPLMGEVAGGSIFQFSGLAHAPDGSLLVGGFQDSPGGTLGAIARSNSEKTQLEDFISPLGTLNGVGNLLVNDDHLYVAAGFAGVVNKFHLPSGDADASFDAPTGLKFPASLAAIPGGHGILVGELGFSDGGGKIARYSFDGAWLGDFATPGEDGGFQEATGMLYIYPWHGDFNFDGKLNGADLDQLAQYIADSNSDGDVNQDGNVNIDDRIYWIEHQLGSWTGDANFDGEFNSGDMVQAFAAGKYELDFDATYAEGDWNGDQRFNSGDLVFVFDRGGYETGPRETVAVPEPKINAALLLVVSLCFRGRGRDRRRV